MFKPPMNNEAIVISRDMTKPPDRHGKRPEKRQPTAARVQVGSKHIRVTDGSFKLSTLEVDLPPEIILTDGDMIEAKDNHGQWHTSQIMRIDESTNFAGNRTIFRTVYCE
jgi:hypothetical protein